jgi:hypothetical protein
VIGREDNPLKVRPKALNAISMNITTPNELTLAVINKQVVIALLGKVIID